MRYIRIRNCGECPFIFRIKNKACCWNTLSGDEIIDEGAIASFCDLNNHVPSKITMKGRIIHSEKCIRCGGVVDCVCSSCSKNVSDSRSIIKGIMVDSCGQCPFVRNEEEGEYRCELNSDISIFNNIQKINENCQLESYVYNVDLEDRVFHKEICEKCGGRIGCVCVDCGMNNHIKENL